MCDQDNANASAEMQLIYEYYSKLSRQGPGSPEITKRALSLIENLDCDAQIADIGCGTGGQTLVIAQTVPGQIRGIDNSPIFIEQFNTNAKKMKLQDRVIGLVGSMENLPFRDGELDLIWSEGAIYNIGFQRGLQKWHSFLKKNGFIAITELSWLTDHRPNEIEDYWLDTYSEIDTIANKTEQMKQAGYNSITTFILPEYCWTTHYYEPQVHVQQDFMKKYSGNKTAEAFIENERKEKALYDRFKSYYGYVFYIGKKVGN